MTDYPYDMDLVVDPLNTANVVANGMVSIYDAADTAGATLLALKDPTGNPLPNPLPSNAHGFLPPRIATVPQTMWKSGGFTGYFNSYKGLRDESVAAVTAAQTAANSATAAANEVVTTAAVDASGNLKLTKANGAVVDAGPVKGAKGDKGDKGDKGTDGANVLPTDDAIKQAINDTASATRGALNATYLDKASGLSKAEAATSYARTMGMGARPWHLDAWNKFFKGWSFATGQGTAATTTAAIGAAGATTLAVASGTGFVDGTVIVMGAGTDTQQINKVASGGGTSTLTLTNPLDYAVASGAEVAPLWGDNGHMNGAIGSVPGWKAWVKFLIEARKPDGTRVLDKPNGKYVFFGNSWMTTGNQVTYDGVIKAVYPNATVVMKGISGNNASQMLARFDTDVPTDATFVIMPEPGVNDTGQSTSRQTNLDNIIALTKKVWAIGAVPVFTGATPFSDKMAISARNNRDYQAIFANPDTFPAISVNSVRPPSDQALAYGSTGYGTAALENDTGGTSTAFGNSALNKQTTGTKNTAVGRLALRDNLTGTDNTAIGENTLPTATGSRNTAVGSGAQASNTTAQDNTAVGKDSLGLNNTGGGNTAVGASALATSRPGTDNTAVGHNALYPLTTGSYNVAVGKNAGSAPNYNAAFATTTGQRQTLLGTAAGQSSATQVNDVVAVGYAALVGAGGAVALGMNAQSLHGSSVALGKDALTTEANQVAIGARSELIGNVAAEPATPASGGVIFVQAGALKYKGSSGTVTVLAPA